MGCKQCGCEIDANRKFCSRSCAASFNNSAKPKRIKTRLCKNCGVGLQGSAKKCKSCYNQGRMMITDAKTVAQMHGNGEAKHKYQKIREHAHRRFGPIAGRGCHVCGYDLHVELCHIKPIAKFKDTEPLEVVNAISNLVLLCPNHHWELDNGLLSIT